MNLMQSLWTAMVGDVNIYMNDLENSRIAEIEIMIAEPKRYLLILLAWLHTFSSGVQSILELGTIAFASCQYLMSTV